MSPKRYKVKIVKVKHKERHRMQEINTSWEDEYHNKKIPQTKIKDLITRGVDCIQNRNVSSTYADPGVKYCESSWDSFLCWSAVPVGETAAQLCPELLEPNPIVNATKLCLLNGTWEATDFSKCLEQKNKEHPLDDLTLDSYPVRITYRIGYFMTIVALVIALFIFTYFRALRCLRNAIHCNLFCGFLLSAFGYYLLETILDEIYVDYPVICTAMVIISHYLHSVPFYWMFVEGLYLFTIIVWAYSAIKIKLWYYLIIGWVVPVIPIAVWVPVKIKYHKSTCLLSPDYEYDHIIHGPVIVLLLGNLIFIVSIIWVLVTKLRASNTLETRQSRKAAKATGVLFPLLGVTYILFIYNPSENKTFGDVFKISNAFLQSFQGMFVAIIYCFLNGEVRSLMRQRLHALQDSRALSRYTKSSFFGSPRRSSLYGPGTTVNGKSSATHVLANTGGNGASMAMGHLAPKRDDVTTIDDATTTLVVVGDPCVERSNDVKSKVMIASDSDSEAKQSMMENML